jgi:V/A-type H+-transporting ATPase subunit K
MDILGQMGFAAALGLSAVGSGLGIGAAGAAAVGAWKKCFVQNRPAPFILIAFVGAPLTQTIYGFILMGQIQASSALPLAKLGAGLFGGLGIAVSAWFQGVIGAAASDAQAETGKGFSNYIIALGLAETVAIFTMVFLITALA